MNERYGEDEHTTEETVGSDWTITHDSRHSEELFVEGTKAKEAVENTVNSTQMEYSNLESSSTFVCSNQMTVHDHLLSSVNSDAASEKGINQSESIQLKRDNDKDIIIATSLVEHFGRSVWFFFTPNSYSEYGANFQTLGESCP